MMLFNRTLLYKMLAFNLINNISIQLHSEKNRIKSKETNIQNLSVALKLISLRSFKEVDSFSFCLTVKI